MQQPSNAPTNPKPSRWWLRLLVVAVGVYWLALFLGTHLPIQLSGGVRHGDKVLHVVAYGLLACLLGLLVGFRQGLTWRRCGLILGGLLLYAALDELLQVPIPGRTGDVLDWVADAIGSVSGLLTSLVVLAALGIRPRTDSHGADSHGADSRGG